MTQWILTLTSGWSPWLATMLIAALPVTESRASIPLALTVFHLSPYAAWGWSMLGNLIPLPIIFLLLPPVLSAAEHHAPRLHRFMEKRLRSLADKHQAAYDRYGALALALFGALPIPGAGVWTGSVLAVVFKVRPAYAIPAIVAGHLVAGVLIVLISQGALGALRWLL